MKLHLSVYGVGVEIVSREPSSEATIESLAEDFAYFQTDLSPPVSIRLTLAGESAPEAGRSLRLFRTRMCEVRQQSFGRRRCSYRGGNAVQCEESGGLRSFSVFSDDAAAEYELAYIALLSAIGEELDLLGYHRVHALGIEHAGKASLVLLPQGGGKSAMALLGAAKGAFRVYSDESPLVCEGFLHPYPVRAALNPEVALALGIAGPSREFKRLSFPTKRLYRWNPTWIAREALPVSRVLIGVRAEDVAIEPLSSAGAAMDLIAYCVVGWGLTQMAEHMLRPLATARLARISVSRAREAYRLGRIPELARFKVGKDARANLATLEAIL